MGLLTVMPCANASSAAASSAAAVRLGRSTATPSPGVPDSMRSLPICVTCWPRICSTQQDSKQASDVSTEHRACAKLSGILDACRTHVDATQPQPQVPATTVNCCQATKHTETELAAQVGVCWTHLFKCTCCTVEAIQLPRLCQHLHRHHAQLSRQQAALLCNRPAVTKQWHMPTRVSSWIKAVSVCTSVAASKPRHVEQSSRPAQIVDKHSLAEP